LQALTTMQGTPAIGLGAGVYGFPVIWVGTNGDWHGSVDLNVTLALRKALQQALLSTQNHAAVRTGQALDADHFDEKELQSLVIPACEESRQSEVLQSALQVLKQNGKRLLVFDLALEPFLKEELAGVFGVLVREEEHR
jgi:hypothetical protein